MTNKTKAAITAAPICQTYGKCSENQRNAQGNADIISLNVQPDALEPLRLPTGVNAEEIPLEIFEIIRDSTLDLTKENPDPIPLLFCGGQVYATRGNFSVIVGLPGSRKSFFATMMVGVYLGGENGFFQLQTGAEKFFGLTRSRQTVMLHA